MIKLFNLVFYCARVGKEFWRMGGTSLFRTYVDSLAQKRYICEAEKEKLIAISNAIFYGEFPKKYIPHSMEKVGEEIAFVDEILEKS
ncbi:MAG: hypothetical protein LBB79_07995 [Prevotellaceae bacterium]|jgi:hypothetical protein|nr:hypothetical protein [Prevotellaceae bacterium]